jgi:predicted RNase H-like HicB family nuclease
MSSIWHIKSATLPIVITFDGHSFQGKFPPLPELKAQGATYDEAVLNIAQAIVAYLEPRIASGGTDGPRIERTA